MVETEAPARPTGRGRLYAISLGVMAAVVGVDQVTKTLAVRHLRDDNFHLFWTLQLNLTFNPGVAFGLGGGSTGVIVLVGVVVLVLLAALGRAGVSTTLQAVAAGMVLGGAVGNMADRLLRDHGGAVVDFIDLQWWPVFNVADMGITLGAILLIAAGFVRSEPR